MVWVPKFEIPFFQKKIPKNSNFSKIKVPFFRIRKKAQKLKNPEYQSLWAGENYRECRKETVAELIERMRL